MLSLTTKDDKDSRAGPSVGHILVESFEEGQRLDNYLLTRLKGVPKTCIYRIVRRGEVRVNKGRVKPSYRVASGDAIRIPPLRYSERTANTVLNAQIDTKDIKGTKDTKDTKINNRQSNALKSSLSSSIIYEDDALLVLNKPSGLAAHGGSGLSFGAIELLRELRPKCRSLELVHRLDRETSGCMLIAKDRKTLLGLQSQLKEGSFEKFYLALVKGQWRGGESIEVSLKKNQLSSGERIVKVQPEGQWSRTEFKILERYPLASLLEAKPITGRTHQIRVHAAYCGNPIAGDPKYGDADFDREMKSFGLKRLFLHARRVTFNLPETGHRVSFEAPISESLLEVQARLRKNTKPNARPSIKLNTRPNAKPNTKPTGNLKLIGKKKSKISKVSKGFERVRKD